MSARQASNNAKILDRAKVVLKQITRATSDGSLAGKDPWAAVLQITSGNEELLDRLGALQDRDLSNFSDSDIIDMVKLSASALAVVLQLILQEQQLSKMQGVKEAALYHWTYSLARFFAINRGPVHEAGAPALVFCSGLLPLLAGVLEKAALHVQQLGSELQTNQPPQSRQGRRHPTHGDGMAGPVDALWHRRFLVSLLMLWNQLSQGWPYGKYLWYGQNGLACTAAPLSKLVAAILANWAVFTGHTAENTTPSSNRAGGNGNTACASGTSSSNKKKGGKKGKHKGNNSSNNNDNMPGQRASTDAKNVALQMGTLCAAGWFVRMCHTDFLHSGPFESWSPPEPIKQLMLSDTTLRLTLTVLAAQVQAQHAATVAAGQQQQQPLPEHHLKLLQLLQCPPLEPVVAKALLIPSFKGAKQLMSAYGALNRLWERRKNAAVEAINGTAGSINPGARMSEARACMGLPAKWHIPVMLLLVEAMLLSPDLFFMLCCYSLIDRMMDDLAENLKACQVTGAAPNEAHTLLQSAAVTFVQEVLLRLAPATRQAWSLERRPSSPTFGKEVAKAAAGTGLVGQFVEGSCATDDQSMLKLLGKVVFSCMEHAEGAPELTRTLQQQLLPCCATFEALLRAAGAACSSGSEASATADQVQQLAGQACITLQHLTAAVTSTKTSGLTPCFLSSTNGAAGGAAAATVGVPQQLVSLLCTVLKCGSMAAEMGEHNSAFSVVLQAGKALHQLVMVAEAEAIAHVNGAVVATQMSTGNSTGSGPPDGNHFKSCGSNAGSNDLLVLIPLYGRAWKLLGTLCAAGVQTQDCVPPAAASTATGSSSSNSSLDSHCEPCSGGVPRCGWQDLVPGPRTALCSSIQKLLGAGYAEGLLYKKASPPPPLPATIATAAPVTNAEPGLSCIDSRCMLALVVKPFIEQQVQALDWVTGQLKLHKQLAEQTAYDVCRNTNLQAEGRSSKVAAAVPPAAAGTVTVESTRPVVGACSALGADFEQLLQQCWQLQTALEPVVISSSTCASNGTDYSSSAPLQCISTLVGIGVADQLQVLGDALNDQVVLHVACNNFPGCRSFAKASEQAKIGNKTCTSCGEAAYCSRECQVDHWKRHKAACKAMQKAKKAGQQGTQ